MEPQTLELQFTAKILRESLQKCQSISNELHSIKSFDRRLADLDDALQPLQKRRDEVRKVENGIDLALESAGLMRKQFALMRQVNAKLQKVPIDDLKSYFDAMGQLRNILCFFKTKIGPEKSKGVISSINSMLAKATDQLVDSFEALLVSNSKSLEPSQIADWKPDQYPIENGTMDLLHGIAVQLSDAGNKQQCLEIYREKRTPILEESLSNLGAKKLSKNDLQEMQWRDLEAKISRWIQMMRAAVKLLYARERIVCEQIFKNIDVPIDECFANVIETSLKTLIHSGEVIAKIQRSPEKLFLLLDMYELIYELQPEIDMILKGKACDKMRESLMSLSKQLACTIYEILHDFVKAVEKEGSKDSKHFGPGAVHPLTRYVDNYVKFLYDYKSMMEQILTEYESEGEKDVYLENVIKKILQALQINLVGKSKQYKDPALCCLFLMNNFQHMVTTVKKSELRGLLGDDWVMRARKNVQRNANGYKRCSWKKVLDCFDTKSWSAEEKNFEFQSNTELENLQLKIKQRLNLFSINFEEVLQKQSQWEVADPELRDSLRLSICEVLLPAYRSFTSRFGRLVDEGENPKKYIEYTYDEVEEKVNAMFIGK